MTQRNYGLVTTAAEFLTHVRRMIAEGKPIGFDIEAGYTGEDKEGVSLLTHHPDWILVGFSFTNGKDWARYVPIAHDDGNNVDNVVATARILWTLLNHPDIKTIAHNAQYELSGTSRWFREVLGNDPKVGEAVRAARGFFPIWSDSMIEAQMVARYDPIRIGKSLKSLSEHVLGQKYELEFRDLFPPEDTDMGPGTPKQKLKYIRFNTRHAASPRIINYGCEDSTACWELSAKHRPEVDDRLMFNVEMRNIPLMIETELEALLIDWPEVKRKADEIARFRDLMNEEIQAELARRRGIDKPVLLTSPKQLSDVLFAPIEDGGLGLPIKKRSDKTQQASTSDDALRVIAQKDPIIKKILTWRSVAKLWSSYLNKYDTQLNYRGDGRAVPSHNLIGANTGRMSVDGVSYQQWPKPYHFELDDGTTFDMNFRDLLISPPDHRIVGFDFSQIELRIIAAAAGETAMIEAFKNDVDIHRATASTMLRIPIERIEKKQRAVGKTSNFAVVYQSGAENIADMLSAQGSPTTKEEAEQMLKDYYAAFPQLRKWMDKQVRDGKAQAFIETPFRRRVHIWEYEDSRQFIRAKGDRNCVNAPIQGGAADYFKMALVRMRAAIAKAGLDDKIRLVLMVHDAMEFYVHNSISDQQVIDLLNDAVTPDIVKMFESAWKVDPENKPTPLSPLPIRADWHVGERWGHVVEIKRDAEGKITGYVNEDDDQVFASTAEAYVRGLALDQEKLAKQRAKIDERLKEAAADQAKKDAEAIPEPTFQAINEHLIGAAEPDTFDDIDDLLGDQAANLDKEEPEFEPQAPSQPGPSEPAPHPGPPSRETTDPQPDPQPVKDAAPFDAQKTLAAAMKVLRDPNASSGALEMAEKAKKRATDALHAEEPEWAHAPTSVPEAEQEEVYVLVMKDMPDAEDFEVAMSWLKKIDEADVYLPTRTIFRTPDGDVEVGTHSLGIKVDDRMKRIERLLQGEWVHDSANKILESA